MEERKRARRDPARPADTVAEIQARLEMCEEDLEEMTRGEGQSTRRHNADLYEEVDEIELLLDELMAEETPGETDPGADPHAHWRRNESAPRWTPHLESMYRDEDEHTAQLARSEEDRRRAAGKRDPA